MPTEELKEVFMPCRDTTGYKDAVVEDLAHVNTSSQYAQSDVRLPPERRRFRRLTLSLLVLSLLANVLLLYKNASLQHAPDLGRSKYSNVARYSLTPFDISSNATSGGLGYDYPVEYEIHTDYSGSNSTLADQLWEAIDSSPIVVALTDEWATAHDLETSARFPWDDAKGIYHVKAFHHLHCLVGSQPLAFRMIC